MPSARELLTAVRENTGDEERVAAIARELGVVREDSAGNLSIVTTEIDRDVREILTSLGLPLPPELVTFFPGTLVSRETEAPQPPPEVPVSLETKAPEVPPAAPPEVPAVPPDPPRVSLTGLPEAAKTAVKRIKDPTRTVEAVQAFRQAMRLGIDVSSPDVAAAVVGFVRPNPPLEQQLVEQFGRLPAGAFTFPARLGGAVVGAAEAVLEPLGVNLVEEPEREAEQRAAQAGLRPIEEARGIPGSESEKAFAEQERIIRERLGKTIYDNLSADISDNIGGIVEILTTAVGANIPEETLTGTPGEVLAAEFERGTEFGRALLGGVAGGQYALLKNAITGDSFKAAPVSTLLTVLPALRGVLRAGGRVRLLNGLEGARKALTTATVAAVGVPIKAISRLFGSELPPAEVLAAAKRWYADALAATDSRVEDVMERIAKEPERVRQEIEARVNQAARLVEEGLVDRDYLLARAPLPRGLDALETFVQAALDAEGRVVDVPSALDAAKLRVAVATALPDMLTQFLDGVPERSLTADVAGRLTDVLTKYTRVLDDFVDRDANVLALEGDPVGLAWPEQKRSAEATLSRFKGTLVDRTTLPVRTVAGDTAMPPGVVNLFDSPFMSLAGYESAFAALPRGSRIAVTAVLADERVASILGPVVDKIQEVYSERGLIRPPEPGLLQRLSAEAPTSMVDRQAANRLLLQVLMDDSVQLLRDPKFRKIVSKRILDAVKEKGGTDFTAAGIDKLLKRMAESTFLEQPFTYVLDGTEGSVVALTEMINAALEMDDTLKFRTQAEAMRRIGRDIGADAERAATAQALRSEIARGMPEGFLDETGTPTYDLPQYASALIDMALRDEPLPQVLVRHSPEQIANFIQAKINDMRDVGTTSPGEVQKIEGAVVKLRQTYDIPSEIVRTEIGLPFLEPDGPVPASLTTNVTAVSRTLNDVMTWKLRMARGIKDLDGPLSRITRTIKASLTALNPTSHVNNFVANLGLQSLRMGTDPVTLMGRLGATADLWRKFKKSGLKDPQLTDILNRMERLGILDSTVIEAELPSAGVGLAGKGRPGKGVLGRVIAKGAQVARGTAEMAGGVYSYGDNIFKLHETLRNHANLRAFADALKPGEWMEFPLDSRRRVRLRNVEGKIEMESVRGLKPKSVDDALVLGAAEPAQALFFDYNDVPLWVQFLRSTPLLGAASPFVTWQWKALDLPGKPGLLSRVLLDGPLVRSNSSTVNQMVGLDLGANAIRRGAVLAAIRNNLQQQPEDALRQIFSRTGKGVPVILINRTTDPSYVEFKDWSSANSFEPTDTIFRGGGRLINLVRSQFNFDGLTEDEILAAADPDRELDENIPAEEQARMRAAGRLWFKERTEPGWDIGDALNLIGLSGNPLAEAVIEVSDASDRPDRSPRLDRAAMTFATLVIGAGPTKVADIIAGATDPESLAFKMSSRKYALRDDDAETQTFVRWAFNRMLGLGWRRANVPAKMDRYVNMAARKFTQELNGALGKIALRFEREGDLAARDGILDKMANIESIVEAEKTLRRTEYQELMRRAGVVTPKE